MPSETHSSGLLLLRWALLLIIASPVLAQEKPQPSHGEVVMESAEVYLAPLRAKVSAESEFVALLEDMGDQEVFRIEDLNAKFKLGELSAEEIPIAQESMKTGLRRLEWLCDEGLRHYAENARVRNFRGNIFYDNFEKQVDAVKEWHTATSLDSSYAEPFNNLGMHYFHTGRYPLGFQNMDKALDLDPDNPDFCFNMAQNYLIFGPEVEKKRGWSKKRVYKEAMKLSKQAVRSAPDDYQLLEDYAVNFLAAENFGVKANWKDAAKAWETAREHAPSKVKLFYTWLNEGRMWKNLNKEKEARRCFEAALELVPDSDIVAKLIEELDSDE